MEGGVRSGRPIALAIFGQVISACATGSIAATVGVRASRKASNSAATAISAGMSDGRLIQISDAGGGASGARGVR